MTESQVIARKFRPKTFDEVVGQEAITRTLSNALTTNRLHHAYLFTGARGVGKTTTARIFAKALNCVKGVTTEPCGVCASCVEIARSSSMDVIEIDAASHTQVETVRETIINTIAISPARDRYKIFIIDEVHMLSNSSFNALLKTLEEPPSHVVFMMATTELQKVPETILSRCQVFEFRTITLKKIVGQLRRIADNLGVRTSDAALLAIARAGEGSMRDAESALDQVISFAGLQVSDEDVSAALGLVDIETLNETIRGIAGQDAARVLRIVDEVVSRGYDLRNFCRELIVHLRALLVVKIAGFDAELVQMPESEGEHLTELANAFSEQDLIRFFSILTKTEQDIRASSQPRFQLEIGLMKLVQSRKLYMVEDALSRLNEIQSQLGGAGLPSPAGGAPPAPAPRPTGKAGPSTGTGGTRPTGRSTQDAAESARPIKTGAPLAESREAAPPAPARSDWRSASRTSSKVLSAIEPPMPLEPPPLPDDPFGYEPESPPKSAPPVAVLDSLDSEAAVKSIIAALWSKNKMLIATALEKAEVKVDGDFLRVVLSPDNARDKMQFDGRDKRQVVEEAAREALGRRLTLSVSIGGQPQLESSPVQKKGAAGKTQTEIDPKLRVLADTFHVPADKIEIKPK
ncbi:MAG TPA: DNA polymerase III subunit gamma/tau [Blastocatellia bacterium]|nr:DNA polymerase III subunit gamma/tau [Blastocatellia bacterium]